MQIKKVSIYRHNGTVRLIFFFCVQLTFTVYALIMLLKWSLNWLCPVRIPYRTLLSSSFAPAVPFRLNLEIISCELDKGFVLFNGL